MAPPKTISQQQVEQQAPVKQQQQQQQAKPRKRNNNNSKAKQQQQQQQQQPVEVISRQQQAEPQVIAKPAERTTVKKPAIVGAQQELAKQPSQAGAKVVAAQPILSKQLTNEENDDTDAGIELDGSSNCGSSVKDMSEDSSSQLLIKSNSVSPVMAADKAASLVSSELSVSKPSRQAAEQGQLEQLTSSKAEKPVSKKQQLAANQQVIDADEQQLQLKLEKRKSSSSAAKAVEGKQQQQFDTATVTNPVKAITPSADKQNQEAAPETTASSNGCTTNKQPANANRQPATNRPLRRFSSQSSQEEGSLCKICEQHVYQMERMLAEKAVYHKRCFRCHQCKIQLRVDNYASHEGQVFCQAHHRQLFQPQVKLDNENDVDIVAKSRIRKRQMIICENEPTELPKDVVRCDTKTDDGIEQLNLNLNNILEKFERATEINQNGTQSQPSSAGIVIEKPSINIKQTLMAFESRLVNPTSTSSSATSTDEQTSLNRERVTERPVRKLSANSNNFLTKNQERNGEAGNGVQEQVKPLAVRRSESLMMRLKKYESRIAGERVEDDDDEDNNDNEHDDNGNAKKTTTNVSERNSVPKKLPSVDLSSLKSQWENGDINKRMYGSGDGDGNNDDDINIISNMVEENGATGGDSGKSPSAEKQEELHRIRQQLAKKKVGGDSIRNIYENAIREAKLQQQEASLSLKRDSSDLSALNGLSTNSIQKQLLQKQNSLNSNNNGINHKQMNGSIKINGNQENNNNNNNSIDNNNSQYNANTTTTTPTTPNKDHFQLNLSNKANKLKEKFELGLITNSSLDHSDESDGDGEPQMTKLEQIRQEKLEDLSVFTEGEIKAREARSLFQQIDRRISAAANKSNGNKNNYAPPSSRSLASIGASMRAKLTSQMTQSSDSTNSQQQQQQQQPIRLTNNVRT